jgi:lipopolysaccharide transport system permease protein
MGTTSSSDSASTSGAASATAINDPPEVTTRAAPSPGRTSPLPDAPLFTIQANKSWSALDLRGLWAYRELLYFLTWRDLKVRYKQAALGLAWVVLQPLMMTVIFTVFLGVLMRVPTDGTPYILFVFAGLLPWTFFSSAIVGSGNSLVANAHLITKVYFPRMLVPAAAVAGRLVDFAVSFVILAVLMLVYQVAPTWNILMLPPLVALTTLLALGCGMLFSALNVRYRDIGIALPVMIQLWMYVSPVLYPTQLAGRLLPEGWRWLYSLNPLVGVVDGFRAALFGGPFDLFALGVSTAFTLSLLVYSAFAFRRVERGFADVI